MAEKLLVKDFEITTIKSKDGEESVESFLENADFIGFYFSAHWCPPCRGFTPNLATFYNKVKGGEKTIKILFVSSDRSDMDFEEYYKEMPWHALPYKNREIKEKMAEKYGISGIPSLVVINKDGEVLTKNGRGKVMNSLDKMPEWEDGTES